ncbi:MAG: APC family permease [Acidiferrobacteraceae bacterium]
MLPQVPMMDEKKREMPLNPQGGPLDGLTAGRVSGLEILGHAVANITPSAMAAVTISLVAANAGSFTWLVYLVVGAVMWLVATQVALLAADMPAAGSLFVYLARALHPLAGVIAGWSMVGGYLGALLAAPVLAGLFTAKAAALMHLVVPAAPLSVAFAMLSWWLAARNVEIAARSSLIIEFVSLVAMTAIGVVTLFHHGFVDPMQFYPRNFHWHGVLRAGTLTVLAFGGFETAGNLAREGRGPAGSAPKAMTASVLLVGGFFVFMAYAVVSGFGNHTRQLGDTIAPLNWLAVHEQTPVLGLFADIGMATAAFSAAIATFNSIARIMYSMARHRILPARLAALHPEHHTPVAALGVLGVLATGFAAAMPMLHLRVLDVIDLFGIFTSLGFLVIYLLALIAAPVHVRRRGGRVPVLSWVALAIGVPVLLRVLATNLYPLPSFPKDWVTVTFFGYLFLGAAVFLWGSRSDPGCASALVEGISGD